MLVHFTSGHTQSAVFEAGHWPSPFFPTPRAFDSISAPPQEFAIHKANSQELAQEDWAQLELTESCITVSSMRSIDDKSKESVNYFCIF